MFMKFELSYIVHILKGTRCSQLRTCEECQANPSCGWCDDGSNTGLGTCMEGGSVGPMVKKGDNMVIDHAECAKPQWYFTSCPRKL